jgi:hypothetical protein
MEGILRRVARKKYRSLMDGQDAYEQIRVVPEHVQRTAMTTPDGNMVSHVLQQGDCNAPATYQALMNYLFGEHIGIFLDVYLDDIIIYSDTLDDHVRHVEIVVKILTREKLYLSEKKLQFLCSEMKILGRVVSDVGICMDPSKVDTVLNWKVPTNRDLCRGFVGSVGYLADDIYKVRIPLMLTVICGDTVSFRWTETEQRAFDAVKRAVAACATHSRVPLDYSPGHPTIWMMTDACPTGVGGVVAQGRTWQAARVAAFYSAKLSATQRNYPVHEQELLAGVETMLRHRDILQGVSFMWLTDHKSLIHLLDQKGLSGRQAHWMEKLGEFTFSIEYVPGEHNVLPDALSRLYDFDAPGTVRAVSEYVAHDEDSPPEAPGLASMPVLVGAEAIASPPHRSARVAGRTAGVPAPAAPVPHSHGPTNRLATIPVKPLGGLTQGSVIRQSPVSADPQGSVTKRSARSAATQGSVIKRSDAPPESVIKRSTDPQNPGVKPIPPSSQPQPARRVVLPAETGRPETSKEFARRVKDRFVLRGPKTPSARMEGRESGTNSLQEEESDPEPAAVIPVTYPNETELLKQLQGQYEKDTLLSKVLESPKEFRNFEVKDGLIRLKLKDRTVLCLPDVNIDGRRLIENIIDQAHSILAHLGADKTLSYLCEHVWWKSMARDVQAFCASCRTCQRSKLSNQRPYGLLNSLPAPSEPWEAIGIDFLGPLPPSKDRDGEYDSITVIIDLLTGMVHLVPSRTIYTAREVVELVFTEVYKHHGLPKAIVSDRDVLFTSVFWARLNKLLGVKLKMSSAYHPQTDGATERANRTVVQMLRSIIGPGQTNWVSKLAAIEFAINMARSESTSISPFLANSGRTPRVMVWEDPMPTEYPGVRTFLQRMKNAAMTAHDALIGARVKQTRKANKRRRPCPFVKGDLVYVSTKNISFPKGTSRKLVPKFVGPYRILEDYGNNSFKLDLPDRLKQRGVHPVFHSSYLREHIPNDDRLFPG